MDSERTAGRGSPKARVRAGDGELGAGADVPQGGRGGDADGSAAVVECGDEGRDGGAGLRAEGGEGLEETDAELGRVRR